MEGSIIGGRYEIMHKIATGGMAEIYLARLSGEGGFSKQVVLKRLHPELASDKLARKFFLREARISGLLTHPNIVQVYDVVHEDGNLYIVMEYIIGQDLRGVVRKSIAAGSLLPLPHVFTIIHQAAQALHHAHILKDDQEEPLGVVHRDVTPTNLLVTMDGLVKLVDFGVAWVRGEEEISSDRRILPGKINYMAPELIKGGKATAQADVFSLGVILYELAVGRRLFRGKGEEVKKKILNGRIPPPTSIKKNMDPELELLILKGIEKDPYHRYESAEEMALELERYATKRGFTMSPVALSRYLRGLFFPELFTEEASEMSEEELDLDGRAGLLDEWRDESGDIQVHGVELPGFEGMDDEELLEILGDPEKAREFFSSQRKRPVSGEKTTDTADSREERSAADESDAGEVVLLTRRKGAKESELLELDKQLGDDVSPAQEPDGEEDDSRPETDPPSAEDSAQNNDDETPSDLESESASEPYSNEELPASSPSSVTMAAYAIGGFTLGALITYIITHLS